MFQLVQAGGLTDYILFFCIIAADVRRKKENSKKVGAVLAISADRYFDEQFSKQLLVHFYFLFQICVIVIPLYS